MGRIPAHTRAFARTPTRASRCCGLIRIYRRRRVVMVVRREVAPVGIAPARRRREAALAMA